MANAVIQRVAINKGPLVFNKTSRIVRICNTVVIFPSIEGRI